MKRSHSNNHMHHHDCSSSTTVAARASSSASTASAIQQILAVPPKRLQVPKACSNCRKMHAGCGVERPCRRCVQNGLEDSCMDVPRKKRASRKKQKVGTVSSSSSDLSGVSSAESSPYLPTSPQHHHHSSPTNNNNNVATNATKHMNQIINNNDQVNSPSSFSSFSKSDLLAMFQKHPPSSSILNNPSLLSMSLQYSNNNNNNNNNHGNSTSITYGGIPVKDEHTEDTILRRASGIDVAEISSSPSPSTSTNPFSSAVTEDSISLPSFSFEIPRLWDEYTDLFSSSAEFDISPHHHDDVVSSGTPISPCSTATGGFQENDDLLLSEASSPACSDVDVTTSLVDELTELKQKNEFLERRIAALTQELSTAQKNATVMTTNRSSVTVYPPHQHPHEFPIFSSYVPQSDVAISVWKTQHDNNSVLVECNERFKMMLGYPNDVLKNQFTCKRLIRRSEGIVDEKSWTKKTLINTAWGVKEVYVTISPINDQFMNPQYYILHMLESCS